MRTTCIFIFISAFLLLARDLNAQNEIKVYLPTPCSLSTSVNDDYISTDKFRLYPNPGDGIINIGFNNITESPAKIVILNMQGVVIYNDIIQKNTLYHSLDVSRLPNGIYMLQIGSSVISKRKIVVLH